MQCPRHAETDGATDEPRGHLESDPKTTLLLEAHRADGGFIVGRHHVSSTTNVYVVLPSASGGSTSNPGSSGVDEDAVIEWFVEEISNCEPPNFTAVIEVREVKVNSNPPR